MGLGDLFKAKENSELKLTVQALQEKISELESVLTPEHRELMNLKEAIIRTQKELDEKYNKKRELSSENSMLNSAIAEKKNQIIFFDDEILVQSFGLYTPRYDFINSSDYKSQLDKIRLEQKAMIKNKTAKATTLRLF